MRRYRTQAAVAVATILAAAAGAATAADEPAKSKFDEMLDSAGLTVSDRVRFRSLGPVDLKGFAQPISVFEATVAE